MDIKQPHHDVKISEEKWQDLNFEGKEFCELKDGHLLQLKRIGSRPARVLTSIDTNSAPGLIEDLVRKFDELKSQFDELEKEWSQTDEKLKLDTKINRFKEMVLHAEAIGDYTPILTSLEEKNAAICSIYNEHLQLRKAILSRAEKMVEQVKAPTDAATTANEPREAPDFKTIKEEWKNAPEIKKEQYGELAERFEQLENEYYEQKRKQHEEKELEMMQNLDRKMDICERAEKLMDSEEWKAATETLRVLMDEWKAIGQVPSAEKSEELWGRFNLARNTFFERKRQHSEKIHEEQAQNLLLKTALIEKAEALKNQTTWKETTSAFNELMNEWRTIGKVPFEKADELWGRLQAARNEFFSAKRESAKLFKAELEENYIKKKQLAERADAIKDSTEWFETTNEMNKLMQEWKKCGPVPRVYGDDLWDKFIAARRWFFDNKDADREKRKARFRHQINNRLHQTTQFLAKITAELKEDEERLADFKQSLENTTGDGPKERELRTHLSNLIRKIEKSIPDRQAKIEDVKQQQEELSIKCKEVNEKNKKNNSTEKNS